MILAVDLAARFSAAVLLDESGQVVRQWDSWGRSPWFFCATLAGALQSEEVDVLVVEDIPYGISRQAQIKPPIRVQGILIGYLAAMGLLDKAYFIAPATWQRHFEGVWKGGSTGAETAALKLGYTHPDLLTRYSEDIPPLGKEHAKERSKIRAQLKKAMTDYDDAFLIAEFSRVMYLNGTLAKLQGVQQVSGE